MSERRNWIMAIAGLLALYVATAGLVGVGLIDDTYIFLRYARNIAEGYGPVFNTGERVEGYTSPLWLAVLTVPALLSANLPLWALLSGGLAGALTIALVARTGGFRAGLLGAAFLATHPPLVYWSFSGMDTVPAAGLVLATLLAAERGRLLLAGTLLGLAVLARPDAAWCLPAVAGLVIWRLGWRAALRQSWQVALPAAALVLTHLAWRIHYYGEWLPNTALAKAGVPLSLLIGSGAAYVARALVAYAPLVVLALLARRYQFQPRDRLVALLLGGLAWFVLYGLMVIDALGQPVGLVAQLVVAYGPMTLLALVPRAPRRAMPPREPVLPLALFAGWWLVYLLVIGGDHFAFGRFVIPAVLVGAVVAGRTLAPMASSRRAALAAGALLVLGNALWLIHPDHLIARREIQLARDWAATGTWFAANAPPTSSIATLVAGAIPYRSKLRTYDLLGLTDSHVARHGAICPEAAIGHQRVASDYILGRRPDYIIFPVFGVRDEPALADPALWPQISHQYWCSLNHLVTRPAVARDYRYRAARLETGTWVEFLERTAD